MLCSQILDYLQNLTSKLRVKCRSRFIKEQNVRIHTKCPCNGYPLLLSTRELRRICIFLIFKTHLFKQVSCMSVNLILVSFLNPYRSICNILHYRMMREQVEVLEHQTECSIKIDLSTVFSLQIGNASKQCRFTRPRRTDNR